MILVALAWMYVVLMVAVVEASGSAGSFLGALFTVALYGVLPMSIVLYLMLSPARRRSRRHAELAGAADPTGSADSTALTASTASTAPTAPTASAQAPAVSRDSGSSPGNPPDSSNHAAGDLISTERKEA